MIINILVRKYMPKVNNEEFYNLAIKKHGISAKGVQWLSDKTQQIRFKIILRTLPKNLYEYSVIDAGCGFGDFFNYMKNKKKLPLKYIGIDTLDSMVQIASKKTNQKILKADICKNKLIEADYYICSGAMNTLEKFETHLFIRNCYEHSKQGFIFNILYGSKESKTYNYITIKEIQDIAKKLKVKKVEIISGYLNSDITVSFLK
jgi:2-polyprenyl-3-methyl-5-hydroxy-6-metoxy-1,4-benzoquinol methylase